MTRVFPSSNLSLSNIFEFTGIDTEPPFSISNLYLATNVSSLPPQGDPLKIGHFRGLSITPSEQFRIKGENGKSWKYDSTTGNIRLNTGVEMVFQSLSDSSVFNYAENSTRRRFALLTPSNGLYVRWSSGGYTCQSYVSGNEDFSFRFITFNGGKDYRIFNDKLTNNPFETTYSAPGTKSTTNYSMYPYTKTWIAYDSVNDMITPVYWADNRMSTSWSFDASLDTSLVNTVSPVEQYSVKYPCRTIISSATTLSSTHSLSEMLYGNGAHIVTVSMLSGTRAGHNMFDGTVMDVWQPNLSTGINEWAQIQLPTPIKLYSYIVIFGTNTIAERSPGVWELHGIPVGSSELTLLSSHTRVVGSGEVHVVVNSDMLCHTFRFVIKQQYQNGNITHVPELLLFGRQV
jgi:hypothetical protein